MDFERLKTYKQYLNTIQSVLNKYFENQAEYIFCKKGCAHCCKKGVYPYSEVEFQYLTLGFMNLPQNIQMKITEKILKLKEEYKNCETKNEFYHVCPFLGDDDECLVYDFRGIICRNFGILQINSENRVLMPFCQSLGLNYSNVYDDENRKFDFSLVEKNGYKNIPKPFPVSRKLLMDKDLFEGEPLDFGESKALIEWL